MTASPAGTSRADARHNRDIVLRTAARVFAEEGMEVSLSTIARRAHVGAGTVYRHFPSKEILIETVLADQIEGLVRAADRWLSRASPREALFGFLLEVIESSACRHNACDALTTERDWPHAVLDTARRHFDEALETLLRNANRAGAIRPGVRIEDLVALASGGAALRSAHPNPARGMRLVRIMLDGLRAPNVTKAAELRDDAALSRHETGGGACCEECGTPLRVRATGRPARYCGAACRQRARRRRVAS
ncbi:helix-turn-helix domain-containing protein [Saccharomonospora sp. NPDC006951]